MLVSVILPVYNGEAYLAEALESIFAQTYESFEVIVIDDGSTDRSREIAHSFPGVQLIEQRNKGVAAARNTGLEAAQGEYIAFLDQDDLWMPDKLAIQVGYLHAHPEVDFLLSRQVIFLEPGFSKPAWLQQRLLDEPHLGVLPGTLLARAAVFEKVGLFDTTFQNSSDMDWFKRAREAGVTEIHLPDIVLRKRIHESNESHRTDVSHNGRMRLLRAAIQRNKQRQAKACPTKKEKTSMTDRANLVSVIIPAYNAEQHLSEAIESVLHQTYTPVEIIVINDGSTDRTDHVARSFGDRIRYAEQENQGVSAARNQGIEMARGDYFAFLDADDMWTKEKLEKQMARFEANPQLDLVFCYMIQFQNENPEKQHIPQPAPLPGAMLIRKTSFFRAGKFDQKATFAEFIPWYSRAREIGLKESMPKEILLKRRVHSDNMGRRDRHKIKEYARLLKESIDRKRANKS